MVSLKNVDSCVPSDVQLEKIVSTLMTRKWLLSQMSLCVSSYFHLRKRFLNIEDKQMVSELIMICFIRSPDSEKDLEHCLQQYG